MIVLILFLITLGALSAQQDPHYPDYYAVNINDYGYKVFSRVRDCRAYQSGDKRILFQDDNKWKIASTMLGSGDPECQNMRSVADLSHESFETTGDLPTEESQGTYKFTSTFYKKKKINIEVEFLQKCEEKRGFRILETSKTQKEYVSRERCERRDYWNGKNTNTTTFIVSFYNYECYFGFIKDLILVKDEKARLFVHSSSCDGLVESKEEKDPMLPKEEKSNRLDQMVESKDKLDSSQEGKVSLVIYICTGGGFLVFVVLIGIGIVIKKIKEKEKDAIVDMNIIYGRNNPGEYYEDGKNTQIEERNDYYGK